MNYLIAVVTTLATLATIILWAKENFKEKPRRLVYPRTGESR